MSLNKKKEWTRTASDPFAAEKSSLRQVRVGEEVRRVLARILIHYRPTTTNTACASDLKVEMNVTVSRVQMGKDLRSAKVFVVPFGQNVAEELSAKGQSSGLEDGAFRRFVQVLTRESSLIRKELGKEMSLRFVPQLFFVPDVSFDQAETMRRLMNQRAHDPDA